MSDLPIVRLESFRRENDCRSYAFEDCASEVVAYRTEEVRDVLAAVESANREGMHAAGFVSYEAAPGLDATLVVRDSDEGFFQEISAERHVIDDGSDTVPLAWFGLFRTRREVDPECIPDQAYDDTSNWQASVTAAEYAEAIDRIRAYIHAGDTYQVNYTFRVATAFEGDAWAFYRALCRSQRANYCAFIDTGDFQILSASPELFFSLKDGHLRTRPMKGTHRRGRWTEEDQEFAADLAGSEKNRAENLMVVDLLR